MYRKRKNLDGGFAEEKVQTRWLRPGVVEAPRMDLSRRGELK
jgi:hypothetical protein